MFTEVVWHEAAKEQLLREARQHAPREFAAVLGGEVSGTTARIHRVVALPNDAIGNDAFEVDAIAFARCEHELRHAGESLLGFAHSHPAGPATPSQRDREQLWADCVQVITDGSVVRAFEFSADRTMRTLSTANSVARTLA